MGRDFRRIHITGASASGTSTLGRALAARRGAPALDTDTFYWMPTDPPFQEVRAVAERLTLLRAATAQSDRWILSGSLAGWGDPLIPQFDAVIFLYVPPEERMARLRRRERERYGDRIAPGGEMHASHAAFVAWAAGYDTVHTEGRNLASHRKWLAKLPCPVLEIEGSPSVEDSVARVLGF